MPAESTSDAELRRRIEASFAAQGAMALLGARLTHVSRGEVRIELGFRPEVAQQHGYFHGGVIATMLDVACGYAAVSCMDPEHDALTAEFKLNFLAPARDGALIARGRAIKPGRTLTVCTGEAYVGSRLVALMQASMATVRRR
jgi:uncharacterized protein (TIGR00369 family)